MTSLGDYMSKAINNIYNSRTELINNYWNGNV